VGFAVKVSYHVFKDFQLDTEAESDEQVLLLNKKHASKIKKLRYSFVSMCYHPVRKTLYLGCTHRSGDILIEFDPRTEKFRSCGFGRSGLYGEFDTKIHQGITLDPRADALYFGIATLTPTSRVMDSKGGALIRYDCKKRKFSRVAFPTPGDFHQGTVFDVKRRKAYIFTDRGAFAVYDMKKRKTLRYECMHSTPHNGVLDDRGGVWGTYGAGRHGFYRYNPDRNRFEFPNNVALPNSAKAANVMYAGAGPVDSILNAGDGFIYVGSPLGELFRLEPRKGEVKYLGKPFAGTRLPGLGLGPDGWLYVCGAREYGSLLGRYSREEERFEFLGRVAHKDGTYLDYAHELVVIGNVVYIGETDNRNRSGYLWACEV
jgi:hypothetical protein